MNIWDTTGLVISCTYGQDCGSLVASCRVLCVFVLHPVAHDTGWLSCVCCRSIVKSCTVLRLRVLRIVECMLWSTRLILIDRHGCMLRCAVWCRTVDRQGLNKGSADYHAWLVGHERLKLTLHNVQGCHWEEFPVSTKTALPMKLNLMQLKILVSRLLVCSSPLFNLDIQNDFTL